MIALFQPLTLVVLLFASMHLGSCMRCHFCLAEGNQCKHSVVVQCEESEVCTIRTREARLHTPEIIIKDCAPRNFCSKEDLEMVPGHCYTCEHELCNSSSLVTPSLINIALLILQNCLL